MLYRQLYRYMHGEVVVGAYVFMTAQNHGFSMKEGLEKALVVPIHKRGSRPCSCVEQ